MFARGAARRAHWESLRAARSGVCPWGGPSGLRGPSRRNAAGLACGLPRPARSARVVEHRGERSAVAGRRASRATRSSCAPIGRRARPAARRGWRARCRATSPASSPAMRVKSRKPLAAKPEELVAVGARRRSRRPARTRARAAGGDTAAKTRSCAPASSVRTPRAAARPQRADARHRLAASVSASGVSTDVAVAEQRRRTPRPRPMCSVPAIGCAGTKRANAAPQRRARRGDDVLLGAAGVGARCVAVPSCGADRAQQRRVLRDRRREQHHVGTGELARPVVVERHAAVDDAERAARRRGSRWPRPTPTTLTHLPRRLSAPVRTTHRSVPRRRRPAGRRSAPAGWASRRTRRQRGSGRQRGAERREKALVLGRQPDRHAQPLFRQPVVGDRADDDAAAQELLVDASRRRRRRTSRKFACDGTQGTSPARRSPASSRRDPRG